MVGMACLQTDSHAIGAAGNAYHMRLDGEKMIIYDPCREVNCIPGSGNIYIADAFFILH